MAKDKLDSVQGKYLKPQNCDNLVVPKINKPVWQQLKQETRNIDSAFQKLQQLSLSSLNAILQLCDNLSNNRNAEDNIPILTDSAVLPPAANRELNLKRRDLLRCDLNKQYAALCNPSTPISTFLFGDDLNKEMDDLSKSSKFTKKITPSTRVEPYRRSTGRSFRGYGSHSFSSRGRGRSGHLLRLGRGQSRNYQRTTQKQSHK